MAVAYKSKPKDEDFVHPSLDRSGRFPQDAWLRGFGYKIHSRRKGCEPVWEFAGELVPESVALTLIAAALDGAP